MIVYRDLTPLEQTIALKKLADDGLDNTEVVEVRRRRFLAAAAESLPLQSQPTSAASIKCATHWRSPALSSSLRTAEGQA